MGVGGGQIEEDACRYRIRSLLDNSGGAVWISPYKP